MCGDSGGRTGGGRPEVEDRSVIASTGEKIKDYDHQKEDKSPEIVSLTSSQEKELSDAGYKNHSRNYAYTGSSINGRNDNALSDYQKVIANQHKSGGLSSVGQKHKDDDGKLYSPVMETAAGDPEILGKLNLLDEEESAVVRDLAHRKSNGLLASVSNVVPVFGPLANGVIDASQANDYSKRAWGRDRSLSSSFADGAHTFGRSMFASSMGNFGPVGLLGGKLLNKALAPDIASYDAGDNTYSHTPGDQDVAKLLEVTPGEPYLPPKPFEPANNNPELYSSHLDNFYNPKSAFAAWE